MEELFKLFNAIHPMSADIHESLLRILKRKEAPKKTFLLKYGHVCNDICFIEKGMFSCFYNVNNKEICSWFMKEGDVIVSVESFFKRKQSYESIQAMEDAIVYYVSHSELNWLYRNFVEFNIIGRVLTENYYTLSEQRLYSLRLMKAADRYNYLMDHFPEIVRRVPNGYIASYLGITIETLNRIKKKK